MTSRERLRANHDGPPVRVNSGNASHRDDTSRLAYSAANPKALARTAVPQQALAAVQRLAGNQAIAGMVVQRQKAGKKPPPHKTTFNLTNSTYSLTGPTLDDVEGEMSGRDEAGYVGWNPTFTTSEYDGKVTKAEVTVDIDLEMPSWTPPKTMNAKGKAEWARWYRALRAHEQGHIDLVKQKMSGVAARMIGKTPAEAQVIFDDAVAALKKASDAYDAKTDHGLKTGTVLDLDADD